MSKKTFRKSIRINDEIISERFFSKADANAWYREMYSIKKYGKHGLKAPQLSEIAKITLNEFFHNDWFPDRKKNYEKPTWGSDEQRFKKYLKPVLGNLPLTKIEPVAVRTLLASLVNDKDLSILTMNRVRALISTIFNDAINRDPPLASINPTFGLRFSFKRKGAKAPSFISTSERCLIFLQAAKELGEIHLIHGSLLIMAGLRKQEEIALKWECVDLDRGFISVKRKYLQASKKIVMGTKRGENIGREVPIPKALVTLLRSWGDRVTGDYVLSSKDGTYMSPGRIRTIHNAIRDRAGVDVTVHGLRHTFGREFAEKSGNLSALQSILGHTNPNTTRKYSELDQDRLKGFQDTVSFDLETSKK